MDIVGGIKKILVGIWNGVKWVFNGIVNGIRRLLNRKEKIETVEPQE